LIQQAAVSGQQAVKIGNKINQTYTASCWLPTARCSVRISEAIGTRGPGLLFQKPIKIQNLA
jgi:hypothetical protein